MTTHLASVIVKARGKEMKYNYQEREITEEALVKKIGSKIFSQIVERSKGSNRSVYNIDIDHFRGGVLIVTNEVQA